MYSLKMPRSVFAGDGSLSNLGRILKDNGSKHPVIFTADALRSSGLLDFVVGQMPEELRDAPVLGDLPAEPSYGQAQEIVDRCKKLDTDFIIALGGGSVIDVAKLASILMSDEVTVKDLLDDPLRGKKFCPTVCIPTTAGTGAEATPNAIVAVPEKEVKIGIVNPEMISDYVILDPVTIRTLPRKLAAATGIDTMAHGIECFTSNKANPLSDVFALRSFELVMKNIVPACDDPDATEAKAAMLLASFFGGVAISASGTTAVHALSYPLGGKYHIAHGVSNAILLTPVMRFNQPAIADRLAAAYDRCFESDGSMTAEEKADALITRMEEIVKHLDIPTSLKEFNVPEEDLETLVASGMDQKRLLNNNLRKVEPEDARAIYRQVL